MSNPFSNLGLLDAALTALGFKKGGGGGSLGSATPKPLGIAAPGTDPTFASRQDHIHAMVTALQTGAIAIPSATFNASTNTVSAGTPPATGNAATDTVAAFTVTGPTTAVSIDTITSLTAGDVVYSDGTHWQLIAEAQIGVVGPGMVKVDALGIASLASPGLDFGTAPSLQWGRSFGNAPTGVVATNGALTVGTALPRAYTRGVWLFFPAGAVLSGSPAGFYWCVMTTTLLGQIFNGTGYIAASTAGLGSVGNMKAPVAPTSVVGAGPGAYVGVTVAIFTPGARISASTIGANGNIATKLVTRGNNSAGAKTVQILLGNTTIFTAVNSIVANTATQSAQVATLQCQDDLHAQIVPSAQDSSVFGVTESTIDMTADQYLQVRLQISVATDVQIVEVVDAVVTPQP